MKKKLSQAIAMATLVGAAGIAQADDMFVNGNSLGDVLLYPLYTADASNDTYISVTNTTAEIKAVKVRILEHKNSQEVLDFNLYLSPWDKWNAAITLDSNGNPVIRTADTSCTVGTVTSAGIQFRNDEYRNDSDNTLARAAIGHIELIEMGNVDPELQLTADWQAGPAIIHGADGKPGNCEAVRQAFRGNGPWARGDDAQNDGVTLTEEGESGLYGTGSIVNVDGGWQASYDAVALANTYDTVGGEARHFKPGDLRPSFNELTPSIVLFGGDEYEADETNLVSAGYNAVSALLSKAEIYNDYVYGAGLNAQTDMVVTFPTKREYVNRGAVGVGAGMQLNAAVSPFTAPWDPRVSTSCETVEITYWDNEEKEFRPAGDDFSPSRPDEFALCYETNILHVGANSNLFGGDAGHSTLNLANGFEAGWLRFDFVGNGHELEVGDGVVFEGMPVIGFSTVAITNGDILGGVLSNYASTYVHKAAPALVED